MDKKQFVLWVDKNLGYGYGSGEEYTFAALKKFLELCSGENESYDYRDLEKHLTPTVAWLMINLLCGNNIIEYGTSPRFAWLDDEGKELKKFVEKYSLSELVELYCNLTEEEKAEIYGDPK